MGQMEPYELDGGEEWLTYIERDLNNSSLQKRLWKHHEVDGIVGPKAYGLLRNLMAPAKPVDKDFREIVRVMWNHLSPKPLIIAERFKFHRRNQGENELVTQYLAELHKLNEKCEFGEYLEHALRDQLVTGTSRKS